MNPHHHLRTSPFRRRALLAAAAALAIPAALAAPSRARGAEDAFPSGPLTLVVPWPPGGSNDLMARLVADAMAGGLGRRVVVDNRPGASGTIGAGLVARAEPDGRTLLWGSLATQVLAPALAGAAPYDPEADFAPISLAASVPLVLLANPAFAARDLPGLIALLRAEPGRHAYASAGDGTPAHLAGELLGRMAGVAMVHVPYQGSGPALAAVVGGHVPLLVDLLPSAAAHVRAGTLRALAVTTARRAPSMPDVPTMAEAAPGLLDGYEAHAWSALFAPARTPRPVIDHLNAEVRRALAEPALRSRLEGLGAVPSPSTPEALAALVRDELVRWAPALRVSGDHAE